MLTYEYREIPTVTGEQGGDEVYLGTPTGDGGRKLPRPFPSDGTVDAGDGCPAEEIYVDPAGVKYAFVTWNVTSADAAFTAYRIDDLDVTFTGATAANTTATAWYVRLGDGGGPPGVSCYALDRVANRFFRRTPIDSAVPPSAWAGGPSRVLATGESSVKAAAVSQIAGEVLIDKLQIHVAIQARFTQWRLRQHTHAAGEPLSLARGDAGVAVAVYEQSVIGKVFNTIPYELFKMLHGGRLDLEIIRRRLTTPASDEPGWGMFDLARLTRDLASIDREHLGRVRRELQTLSERSRTMIEVVDRVAKG